MQKKELSDREKIAAFLKKWNNQYRQKLKEMAKVSYQTVKYWFQSKSDNESVTNAVVALQAIAKRDFKERKNKRDERAKQLSQLAEEVESV